LAESKHELVDSEGHRFRLEPWRCPVCKKSEERVIGLRGGKYHRYGLGVVNRIVQCRTCKLLYANPFPIPVDPQKLYGDPAKYFVRHDEQGKVDRSRELIREISKRLGRTSYRLLDIGSGRGELLQAAKLEGVEATGLEFSDAMIEHTRKTYGMTPIAQSIEDYAASAGIRFEAFTLNAVLEHVYDPDAMIAAVAKLAAPGAILYIDVPNEPNLVTRLGNLVQRAKRSPSVFNLSPSWTPYHVYGFNPRALGHLLAKHGFAITETEIFAAPYIPSKPELKDRIKATVAEQVIRVGNWVGMGSNMVAWGRKT
jgi:2-polyprenyl-3-methyl-5-hydroxy-6-metoxy-1,4-benzoquinol methylase